MTTDQLHALLIDDHFGELSPEVKALLTAYLEANLTAKKEASVIKDTLGIMSQTLQAHPKLAQVEEQAPVLLRPRVPYRKVAAAAAALLMASLGTSLWLSSPTPVASTQSVSASPGFKSPWTRYRLAADPKGNGLNITPIPQ